MANSTCRVNKDCHSMWADGLECSRKPMGREEGMAGGGSSLNKVLNGPTQHVQGAVRRSQRLQTEHEGAPQETEYLPSSSQYCSPGVTLEASPRKMGGVWAGPSSR